MSYFVQMFEVLPDGADADVTVFWCVTLLSLLYYMSA